MTVPSAANARAISLTVEITSAYVSHNHVRAVDLPRLVTEVYRTVASLAAESKLAAERQGPNRHQIERSIADDFLISFEDGRAYKTLRRHLALHGLTPEAYRAKWGLGPDYPMTAPAYSQRRSELARALGLGRVHRPVVAKPSARRHQDA